MRLHDTKSDCLILDHAGLSLMHGSLLDEPEVDLTKGIMPRKKDSDPHLQLTTCLVCYAVFRATLRACPNCGEQRQGALPLEEHDGELQEVASCADLRRTRRNREVAKARSLEELRAIGIKRGYHPRWAEHVWRHRKPRRERAMA